MSIKNAYIIFAFLLLVSGGKAQEQGIALDSFDKGNVAYKTGKYTEAIAHYEEVANNAIGMVLYYNLGNAYFKNNQIPEAILNYERALKYEPGNEDVKHNLELANIAVIDKIEALPPSRISEWWNGFKYGVGPDAWAWICVGLMFGAFLLFTVYYLSQNTGLRRFGFFGGLIVLLLSISAYFLSSSNKSFIENKQEAIIFAPKVDAHSEPNPNSNNVFTLHEGTKVKVLNSSDEWFEIAIASGNKGWIKKEEAEEI